MICNYSGLNNLALTDSLILIAELISLKVYNLFSWRKVEKNAKPAQGQDLSDFTLNNFDSYLVDADSALKASTPPFDLDCYFCAYEFSPR